MPSPHPPDPTGSAAFSDRWPALRGGLLALAAAVLFGASTPALQHWGADLGPWTSAALLYLGASSLGALLRQPVTREARLRRSDGPRLMAMAVFGAALGPAALAWGLQHGSGVAASLLLCLEAVFTALLARLWYREHLDRRVTAALVLISAGAMLLVLGPQGLGSGSAWGLLAVAAATLAWAVDNSLSRPLAERDPGQVVRLTGALGAALSGTAAWLSGEPAPGWTAGLGLLAVGATGYGLSLRLYLLAQRAFGAARTGSVFGLAPLVGAALAWALGDRSGSWASLGGATLMGAGLWLHLAEDHAHEHTHEPLTHEHAHHHGDAADHGHHDDHHHEVPPSGPHSHPHVHSAKRHHHPHVPDEHHQHVH